jgi:hypothetical protein
MLRALTRTRYVLVDADGELPFALSSRRAAIRTARSVAASSPRNRLIRVIRHGRGRKPREVWISWGREDGPDEAAAGVRNRPRRPLGSGAVALPLPPPDSPAT